MDPETFFAIVVEAKRSARSGSSCSRTREVSAEVGYWLVETFWGRGIAT